MGMEVPREADDGKKELVYGDNADPDRRTQPPAFEGYAGETVMSVGRSSALDHEPQWFDGQRPPVDSSPS